MTEIADRFRRRAAAFTERVDAVPPDRWEQPVAVRRLGRAGHRGPHGQQRTDVPRFRRPRASRRGRRSRTIRPPPGPARGTRSRPRSTIRPSPRRSSRVMSGKQTFERAVDRFGGPDWWCIPGTSRGRRSRRPPRPRRRPRRPRGDAADGRHDAGLGRVRPRGRRCRPAPTSRPASSRSPGAPLVAGLG